jgi:hypothetical protein
LLGKFGIHMLSLSLEVCGNSSGVWNIA